MVTPRITELDLELARRREDLHLLEAARKREAGIPAQRVAARDRAKAAYEQALAAQFAVGEVGRINGGPGFVGEPYAELRGIDEREFPKGDPSLPTPAEVRLLQRNYAEAVEGVKEAKAAYEKALIAATEAEGRAEYLTRACAAVANLIRGLERERERERAHIAPSPLADARARLARLRRAAAPTPAAKGD